MTNEQQRLIDYYIGLNTRAEEECVAGPIKGHCPNLQMNCASSCWKFHNSDIDAYWDFFWMLVFFDNPVGELSLQMSNRIPLDNGEFIVTLTPVDAQAVKAHSDLNRLRITQSNFSVVRMTLPKVAFFHQQVMKLAQDKPSTFIRLNANWQLLESKTVGFEQLPSLSLQTNVQLV
jgi:hypothetical protein